MADVFGLPERASGNGGEFVPVLKFDARAGRFFRVDRVNTGNGFESEVVDITQNFKAIFDFENIEIGWMLFIPGVAPDMKLVPMGQQLPDRPSPQHQDGLRFMVKLAKECGGDQPIREVSGTSKALRSGIEPAYLAYLAAKDANPGKLPVFALEKTTPVKTGSGAKSSTNYHPTFNLVGWVQRGDLVFMPRASTAPTTPLPANTYAAANGATPPTTGSTVAAVPVAKPAMALADDFG